MVFVPKPRTRSFTFVYTYDSDHEYAELNVSGEIEARNWRLSERRSDLLSVTRLKSWETRASREAMNPVRGSMLVGCT